MNRVCAGQWGWKGLEFWSDVKKLWPQYKKRKTKPSLCRLYHIIIDKDTDKDIRSIPKWHWPVCCACYHLRGQMEKGSQVFLFLPVAPLSHLSLKKKMIISKQRKFRPWHCRTDAPAESVLDPNTVKLTQWPVFLKHVKHFNNDFHRIFFNKAQICYICLFSACKWSHTCTNVKYITYSTATFQHHFVLSVKLINWSLGVKIYWAVPSNDF